MHKNQFLIKTNLKNNLNANYKETFLSAQKLNEKFINNNENKNSYNHTEDPVPEQIQRIIPLTDELLNIDKTSKNQLLTNVILNSEDQLSKMIQSEIETYILNLKLSEKFIKITTNDDVDLIENQSNSDDLFIENCKKLSKSDSQLCLKYNTTPTPASTSSSSWNINRHRISSLTEDDFTKHKQIKQSIEMLIKTLEKYEKSECENDQQKVHAQQFPKLNENFTNRLVKLETLISNIIKLMAKFSNLIQINNDNCSKETIIFSPANAKTSDFHIMTTDKHNEIIENDEEDHNGNNELTINKKYDNKYYQWKQRNMNLFYYEKSYETLKINERPIMTITPPIYQSINSNNINKRDSPHI